MAEDHIYLTVDKHPNRKGLIAVISRGHPQFNDVECLVLSVAAVPNMKAAKTWYKQMKVERPWELRN